MATKVLLTIIVVFALASMIAPGAGAQIYGPRLLVQEDVTGAYYDNGTVKTTASSTGQFFVSVPNKDDVLQYIRITLGSGYGTNTNIENETGAYHDVIASWPSKNSWQLLYTNVTGDDAAASYIIDDANVAPTINLSMYYRNERGGNDLYDEGNIDDPDNNITINFSLTNPSSGKALNGVTSYIYLERDVSGSNDIEVIAVEDYGVGNAQAHNSDGGDDSQNDRIEWTGINIPIDGSVNLTVTLNVTSGIHIGSLDEIDLDEGTTGPSAGEGMNATYSSTGDLFSGVYVSDKLSRGPIRQGVDLSATGGSWYVRGFIRNMAEESPSDGEYLTYNMSEWRVYEIDPVTGVPYSVANQTGTFNQSLPESSHMTPSDGRIYTTSDSRSSNVTMYNASTSDKPYMAVYFDWDVIWNSTNDENNLSYINTTMDLPVLYLLDISATKSASGTVSPNVGGENVTINDTLTNEGANETEPHFVQVLSYAPSNTTNNEWRGAGWNIQDDVQIYLNGTYRIDPDNVDSCFISVTDPTEAADGWVNLTIYDLPNCDLWDSAGKVGHTFDENDYITISYRVMSNNQMGTGDTYVFWGTGQLNSSSDTMDKEYFTNETIVVAGKRVTGYKDLIAHDPEMPTMINSTINLSVETVLGSYISGIKFMDYVPANTISYSDYVGNFSNGDATLIKNGTVLTYGVDYDITDNSTAALPDGITVHRFEFVNASGNSTWNLTGGEYIEVSYQINFTTPGAYMLPVVIAAFDPDTGISLNTAFYGVIKVTIPEPNIALAIDEDELRLSKTVPVGKPAAWTKDFNVYNPNPRQVSASFETVVFDDATDGYVSYIDENGRRVDESTTFSKDSQGRKVMRWQSSINALETRNYDVTVLTPPVLEIDRDIEVMEQLPEKKVRLKMDVYLKSFAQEDYENVILNLPIAYQNVEVVRDGFGNRLPFTGGTETTSITVDVVRAGQLKTVTVIYKESYPTIIITPDRDRYNLNSPVSLEILVINGGEKIDYPYLEIEIYTPGMDVVFTNIAGLEKMEPLEKTKMYERFVIPATAPSGMYIASARFREDFAVLASATGNFYVMGIGGGGSQSLEIIVIILVSAILVYFSFKRLREVRRCRKTQRYGGI